MSSKYCLTGYAKSTYAYILNVTETSRVYIGLHQDDERIEGIAQVKPYIPMGIEVFSDKEGSLDLVYH